MFSHFFIDRPVLATVLSVVIVIVGGVAMNALPISQYPDIAPPTISITTVYPGASAKVVADTVATRSNKRSTASRTCSTCPPARRTTAL